MVSAIHPTTEVETIATDHVCYQIKKILTKTKFDYMFQPFLALKMVSYDDTETSVLNINSRPRTYSPANNNSYTVQTL